MNEIAATPDTAPAEAPLSLDDRRDHMAAILQEAPEREEVEHEVDASDPEPPEEETEAPQTHRVKVRGQEVEVTLDELLKGYSRTEDYKAKTAEVAEQRRKADAELAAIANERQTYARQLDTYIQQAQAFDPILAEGMKTDWARLAQENPVEYVQRSAQFQQRQAQVQQAIQERNALAQREMAERLQAENAKLVESLPEWGDDTKRATLVRDMTGYLGQLGFSPDEVGRVMDSRVILLVHKAMQAEKLERARKSAEAKQVPPQVPRVAAPGAAGGGSRVDARTDALVKRAKTTGSLQDRGAAISALLNRRS